MTATEALAQVREVNVIPPKPPKKSSSSIGVSLPKVTWEKIDAIVELEGGEPITNRNRVLRYLIERGLEVYETKARTSSVGDPRRPVDKKSNR